MFPDIWSITQGLRVMVLTNIGYNVDVKLKKNKTYRVVSQAKCEVYIENLWKKDHAKTGHSSMVACPKGPICHA